ncbi:hypothetical protein [Paenibacillus harenae]|uniref:hypothetical protein n=1 Tax=Paenibacillus harenae TaxID=306543 RepID=UPI00279178DA|nr:hypothetical protein [Paenibacillus harenae]MDQ0059905.1 hypothetical protein [Paenibacillus harenae]
MGTKTLPAQRANKEPFVAEQLLPRQDAKNILRWPQKEQEKTATPLKPERWALFLSVYLSGYSSRWQICLFFSIREVMKLSSRLLNVNFNTLSNA